MWLNVFENTLTPLFFGINPCSRCVFCWASWITCIRERCTHKMKVLIRGSNMGVCPSFWDSPKCRCVCVCFGPAGLNVSEWDKQKESQKNHKKGVKYGSQPKFLGLPPCLGVCVCLSQLESVCRPRFSSSGSEERPLAGTPVRWLQQTEPRCWKKQKLKTKNYFRLLAAAVWQEKG